MWFNVLETEDTSSNDDKDIFGSTHPMLFTEQEADFFTVSSYISVDCQHNADCLKQESNNDGDKGTL